MNKAVGIGITVAVIVGIIIVGGISMNSSNENSAPIVEENTSRDSSLEESLSIEEETQKVETEGRSFSVELSETVNLRSP